MAGYKNQLAGLEFDFKTISGSLNMVEFNPTLLRITANNVVYKGTPIDVSGAAGIEAAEIEITLNGTFDLSGSEAEVASGTYTCLLYTSPSPRDPL